MPAREPRAHRGTGYRAGGAEGEASDAAGPKGVAQVKPGLPVQPDP